jgi:hypothetical protein
LFDVVLVDLRSFDPLNEGDRDFAAKIILHSEMGIARRKVRKKRRKHVSPVPCCSHELDKRGRGM